MTDSLITALGIVGTVCAVLFGYLAFARNRKRDDKHEAASDASLSSDIGYIKAGNDEIKRQLEKLDEKQEKQHLHLIERVTHVEASAKLAHKQIDDIKRKLPT